MGARAEFSSATRRLIAERAGYQCSVLNCGRLTVGPNVNPKRTVNVGMAAHIYAASPGGPRGTGDLSVAERSDAENGIWCCFTHGKEIDSDNGRSYSAVQLRAWKRLHETRKAAEITGRTSHHVGLVESISINAAPIASLAGRKFDLGMRNIIIGPNGSGKTMLTQLIASVAYPDYIAKMSRDRDVDVAVQWFDPNFHNVSTRGRAGDVSHVLNGTPVPYVARPYKTILLNDLHHWNLESVVDLAQQFDLSVSAMKSTLLMLSSESTLVKSVEYTGTQAHWTLNVDGHTFKPTSHKQLSGNLQTSILLDLVGAHARHHARVEPTLLILDGFMDFLSPEAQISTLDRLQHTADHAQVAIVSHRSSLNEATLSGWTPTILESSPFSRHEAPFDFEVNTGTES